MKFKNILSLSLAFLMTFTATLSSSVSIFADDVEIPQTEESQSFTSSIFEDLLLKSEESNIENPDDYGISPMWLKDDHDDLIRNAIKSEGLHISEDNIKIMVNAAKVADLEFGSKSNKMLKNLHGAGNYVASLKFLWNFSLNLYNKQTTANAKNNALNSLTPTLRADSDITEMAKKLANYIDGNTTSTQYNKRKFIICGFACHLIADTFAHRTIVPKSTVTSASNTKTNSKFGKNHFDTQVNAITDSNKLKKYAKNAGTEVEGRPRVRCWQAFKQTVNLGVMEFRDVKHYMKESVDTPNKKYEDSISFCSYRYEESKLAVGDFLGSFSGGFDAFIYYPVCGAILNNFYGYTKATDNSLLSFLTTNEWKSISTMTAV